MEKKGLSTVVVSLILIVVALAAVAVVWVIVNNVIGGSTGQVNLQKDCLDVKLTPTRLVCSGGANSTCDVTVERGAGGKAIAGMKLSLTNSTGANNFVSTSAGDVAQLETKTVSSVNTGIANVNKVDVNAYFTDASGNELVCSTASSYSN